MPDKSKAALFAALAFGALIVGCVLASIYESVAIAMVSVGFAGYLLCARRALRLWRVDDAVFIPRRIWVANPEAPSVVTVGLLMGAIGSATLGEGAGRTVRPIADGARRVRESSSGNDEVRRPLSFPSRASRTKSFDDV